MGISKYWQWKKNRYQHPGKEASRIHEGSHLYWWDPRRFGGIPTRDPGSHQGSQVGLVRSPGPLPLATPTSDSLFSPGILGKIGRIPPVPLGTSTWRFHDNKYLYWKRWMVENISRKDKVTNSELYVSLEKVTNSIQNRSQSRITWV